MRVIGVCLRFCHVIFFMNCCVPSRKFTIHSQRSRNWKKRFWHLWETDWNAGRVDRFCVFIVQIFPRFSWSEIWISERMDPFLYNNVVERLLRPQVNQQMTVWYCRVSGLCIPWKSVCRQFCKQILVCEVLFFSTSLPICCHHCFRSCIPGPCWILKDQTFKYEVNFIFCLLRDNLGVKQLFFIVFLLNEGVHGFHNIRNGRVKTTFQIVNFKRLWKFFIKKHELSLCDTSVPWWVSYFRNRKFPLTFQIQLLR